MNFAFQRHHDDCDCAQCDRARRAADAIIKAAMESADREYERRGGIPILRPIESRPLIKPTFTAADKKSLSVWIAENSLNLFDWFHATMHFASDDETWESFCAEQFYQQQTAEQLTREWM